MDVRAHIDQEDAEMLQDCLIQIFHLLRGSDHLEGRQHQDKKLLGRFSLGIDQHPKVWLQSLESELIDFHEIWISESRKQRDKDSFFTFQMIKQYQSN